MDQDIIPADKNLRKKFFIFLGLVTMAVILVAPYMNDYIDQIKQMSKENPDLAFKKSIFTLKVSLGLVSILLLMAGVYLISLARNTLKSGQYPPPGMRVIRETRLRTGMQAKMAGISLIILSRILIIIAFFFFYFPMAFERTVLKKKGPATMREISEKGRGVIELKKKGGETK
jgi:hypothetical protein